MSRLYFLLVQLYINIIPAEVTEFLPKKKKNLVGKKRVKFLMLALKCYIILQGQDILVAEILWTDIKVKHELMFDLQIIYL